MKVPRRNSRAQHGAALLAMLAVVVLMFAYFLTSRFQSAAGVAAVQREHNAKVLNQAKQALIGWMALNAAQTDNNPGRLPCPEGVNNIGSPSEGIAAPTIAPPPTPPSPNCSVVGRLPWRTLGLDKLVDAAAEPLWYAVSPGWALQSSGTQLSINSDSLGAMVVDGQAAPNQVVALIVAPGPAMTVQAAPGCPARAQSRGAPAPSIDPADYLECFNAGTPAFFTVGPATSFNDQVLTVTAGDLVPVLEAAISHRMQREIAPALRSVYASAAWGTSSGNPLYPFAARFDNPHPGTASYRGEDGRYRGLLPFNSSSPTCGGDPRCTTSFVSWNTGVAPTISIFNGLFVLPPSCTISASTVQCTGVFLSVGTATLRMTARANNVAMAMRTLTPGNMTIETGLLGYGPPQPGNTASASFNASGSADLTMQAAAPGLLGAFGIPLNVMFRFTADLGVLADHPLLDPTNPTTGWFVRNEWYRLVYYAVAPESTADGLPAHGCNSTNCMRFNDPGTRNIRALLVLAGRSMTNPTGRPNGTLTDYLEYQNCDFSGSDCNPQTLFEQRPIRSSNVPVASITAPWNDRVVLVDWIAPSPTFPLAALP